MVWAKMASAVRVVPPRASISFRWVWAVGLIVLFAAACGKDQASQAPDTTQTSYPPAPQAESPHGPGLPQQTPGAIGSDPGRTSDYTQVDQAVQRLVTRNATWQAPATLKVGKTDNIALAIGDVQSLRDEITRTVPTVWPRPPHEIEIGSTVRAKLTAIASDATVGPLEPINKSIGEQTSILFPWQVTPLKPGELNLVAHIEFPLTDEHVTTETVPLFIPVDPVQEPWSRTVGDLIKNYWPQITAVGAALLAAARLGWGAYQRRRNIPAAAGAEEGPNSDAATSSSTQTNPPLRATVVTTAPKPPQRSRRPLESGCRTERLRLRQAREEDADRPT
jgi:hypothetical protein